MQQPDRDDDLRPDFRVQENDRRKQITDRDALQHAGYADRRELEIGKTGEKYSQREDDQRTPDDLQIKVALAAALFHAPAKCERDSDANDEQEERKNKICGSPTMPTGMGQRPIDVAPRARIVDQDHPGDRDAAEDIERNQPVVRC